MCCPIGDSRSPAPSSRGVWAREGFQKTRRLPVTLVCDSIPESRCPWVFYEPLPASTLSAGNQGKDAEARAWLEDSRCGISEM